MKIIVTGSRNWADVELIFTHLEGAYRTAQTLGESLVVVHGHCEPGEDSPGADAISDEWVSRRKRLGYAVGVRRYPADWYAPCLPDCYHRPRRSGGKCVAAGPRRNQKMVDENLDARIVLAFPLGEGRGTRGCMEYAESKGLRVRNLGEK